ncbi:methylated-DNA--[protein]-cysteine S-methyltransferase [Streptomyces gobiensis]|uniref:methylated-DNA--[protein]-cysteine S-methyltransferase n=1 Tax=Streptomyces gobiensis TaxID=2875706 RepID=UPI001E59A59C|nr:methylated-DNA--[protein]-cysteine S-methyltransferase [Streptomyces gobiensis]UGY94261.1 methylated-DNA--[protein]-cysteine S-methyltransferase [Streptomyces gobiensis]
MSTSTMLYTVHPSPLGELLVAGPEPGVLASVSVPGQRGRAQVRAEWTRDDAALTEAVRQLDAYFAGELKEFGLRLAPAGTDFRHRIWAALDRIPYGSTVTYGELAAMAGMAGKPVSSARAVGGAVGANPLLVVRPCHRVIGANGALTGYAGGMERKQQLLTLEGAPAVTLSRSG